MSSRFCFCFFSSLRSVLPWAYISNKCKQNLNIWHLLRTGLEWLLIVRDAVLKEFPNILWKVTFFFTNCLNLCVFSTSSMLFYKNKTKLTNTQHSLKNPHIFLLWIWIFVYVLNHVMVNQTPLSKIKSMAKAYSWYLGEEIPWSGRKFFQRAFYPLDYKFLSPAFILSVGNLT